PKCTYATARAKALWKSAFSTMPIWSASWKSSASKLTDAEPRRPGRMTNDKRRMSKEARMKKAECLSRLAMNQHALLTRGFFRQHRRADILVRSQKEPKERGRNSQRPGGFGRCCGQE